MQLVLMLTSQGETLLTQHTEGSMSAVLQLVMPRTMLAVLEEMHSQSASQAQHCRSLQPLSKTILMGESHSSATNSL